MSTLRLLFLLPVVLTIPVACVRTRAGEVVDAGASIPRIAPGAAFRVAGRHEFEMTTSGSASWRLERLAPDVAKAPDDSMRRVAATPVEEAIGARAAFTLAAPDSESVVYRVIGRVGGAADTAHVRVFPPDRRSSFVHHGAAHPPVRVFLTVPATLSARTRVVLVMHGVLRNADEYADSWVGWAAANDYVAAAPEFTREAWPGGRRYNLGNVIAGEDRELRVGEGVPVPEREWSFTVVDDLQARLRRDFALADSRFDLWGHSAGGQFVHRFMLFKPNAPVRLAVAANSGWYTTPELDVPFPAGVRHPALGIGPAEVARWTSRPLLIMRGTADTVRDRNFPTGPEADRQGLTRYARAAFMLERARAANPGTTWRLEDVPGSNHDQKKMAPPAQAILAARRR